MKCPCFCFVFFAFAKIFCLLFFKVVDLALFNYVEKIMDRTTELSKLLLPQLIVEMKAPKPFSFLPRHSWTVLLSKCQLTKRSISQNPNLFQFNSLVLILVLVCKLRLDWTIKQLSMKMFLLKTFIYQLFTFVRGWQLWYFDIWEILGNASNSIQFSHQKIKTLSAGKTKGKLQSQPLNQMILTWKNLTFPNSL